MSREYPCVYYDGMKCRKFEEPGYVSWCVLGPCSHETPSNADRIRAMSDEELASVLLGIQSIDCTVQFCQNKSSCEDSLQEGEIPEEWCRECLLEWLQQPADEYISKDIRREKYISEDIGG